VRGAPTPNEYRPQQTPPSRSSASTRSWNAPARGSPRPPSRPRARLGGTEARGRTRPAGADCAGVAIALVVCVRPSRSPSHAARSRSWNVRQSSADCLKICGLAVSARLYRPRMTTYDIPCGLMREVAPGISAALCAIPGVGAAGDSPSLVGPCPSECLQPPNSREPTPVAMRIRCELSSMGSAQSAEPSQPS
jgi:hypothetical protein